jgi:hypothetical protein
MNTYLFTQEASPPSNIEILEPLNTRHENGTLLTFSVNGELREYIYEKEAYGRCDCGKTTIKFGYIPSNNSMNVYCDYCWKKYNKGLKLFRPHKRRDTKHAYFAEHQRKLGRYFCEICFHDKYLQVHHIEQVKDGGSDDPENLALLCDPCHTMVHTVRAIAKRRSHS